MLIEFGILLCIIFLVIIIIGVFLKFTHFYDNTIDSYQIWMPISDNAKNMNKCPFGCVRGSCNKSNSNNGCKYNFQCEYCKDRITNQFYVEFNDERNILPLYAEEEELTNRQKTELNKSIDKNNKYIKELNKRIMILDNMS